MPGKPLTEKQILKLTQKLNKVNKLRNEILVLADDSQKAETLKKKIAEILVLLNLISSSAASQNKEFDFFLTRSNMRLIGMGIQELPWPVLEREVQLFCDQLNSTVFNFSGREVKIITTVPKQTKKRKLKRASPKMDR